MSFAQLFSAGKSFIGMHNARSPYRIRPENRLPKFESTKNPFASKAEGKRKNAEGLEVKTAQPSFAPAPKVAPMETYPLFDSELKPVVRNETPPVRGSVRVVTVSQSRLPQSQARACRSDDVPTEAKMGTRMKEATVSGGKVGDAANRAPSPPSGTVEGLMDGSPLGLKTGKPSKNKLPAPVLAEPKGDRPQNQNNTVTVESAIEHFLGLKGEAEVEEGTKTSNIQHPTSNAEVVESGEGLGVKLAEMVQPAMQPVVELRRETLAERANVDVAKPVAQEAAAPVVKSANFGTWLRKFNPFAYLPKRIAEKRAAKTRTPVQAELSLEKVKVIRNDLSDADLELVSIRRSEKPKAAAAKLEPIEPSGIGRLTARFFGTEQV